MFFWDATSIVDFALWACWQVIIVGATPLWTKNRKQKQEMSRLLRRHPSSRCGVWLRHGTALCCVSDRPVSLYLSLFYAFFLMFVFARKVSGMFCGDIRCTAIGVSREILVSVVRGGAGLDGTGWALPVCDTIDSAVCRYALKVCGWFWGVVLVSVVLGLLLSRFCGGVRVKSGLDSINCRVCYWMEGWVNGYFKYFLCLGSLATPRACCYCTLRLLLLPCWWYARSTAICGGRRTHDLVVSMRVFLCNGLLPALCCRVQEHIVLHRMKCLTLLTFLRRLLCTPYSVDRCDTSRYEVVLLTCMPCFAWLTRVLS